MAIIDNHKGVKIDKTFIDFFAKRGEIDYFANPNGASSDMSRKVGVFNFN